MQEGTLAFEYVDPEDSLHMPTSSPHCSVLEDYSMPQNRASTLRIYFKLSTWFGSTSKEYASSQAADYRPRFSRSLTLFYRKNKSRLRYGWTEGFTEWYGLDRSAQTNVLVGYVEQVSVKEKA
ncbi:hypothetical protein AVEN_270313-1 [Araneus ventricosus]|uniref:Uncharacterized protein n=1 Tax=Araneus ventricosus TaxID=182803 RepID=A0A4Y2PIE0_ARAVE|nr:hypothetical protein AVEN_270313-1 [Araneus ventricosus]